MYMTLYRSSDDFFSDHSLLILGLNSKKTKSKMDIYILRYINYLIKKLILKEIKPIYFDLDKKRIYQSKLFIYRIKSMDSLKLTEMLLKAFLIVGTFTLYLTYKSPSNAFFNEPTSKLRRYDVNK
jgi:hypothetical protein